MNWLAQGEAFPPPGRVSMTLAEARDMLVANPPFNGNARRAELWTGLERYVSRFLTIQEKYQADLGETQIVKFLWLGGSFVSRKLEPRNIDVTVGIDARARRLIRGKPGTSWLTDAFYRDGMLAEFGLSPIELQYVPVNSPFRLTALDPDQLRYLQQRGAWDDWWQRLRDESNPDAPPGPATVRSRRGYIEVTL